MQIFRPATLGALACLIAPPPSGAALAQDGPKIDTFGRWSVIVDEVSTGQDARKTCAASTAFTDAVGVAGTLTLAISNGDALPPDAYPTVTIAIDNKDLPTGKKIAATFGDSKGQVTASVHSDAAVNGRLGWSVDNQAKTSLAVLRAMRRAGTLDVAFADKPVATISMDGFTKAYRSLGVSCGFPTTDVAP